MLSPRKDRGFDWILQGKFTLKSHLFFTGYCPVVFLLFALHLY